MLTMAADKAKTQRRVYVLPTELVDRLVAYQAAMGFQSEVETVRRLLDEALKSRDDWRTITRRVVERLKETRELRDIAGEILIQHPLVTSVNIDPSGVKFQLKTGEAIEVDPQGNVNATDDDGRMIELDPKPRRNDFGRGLDDEIPF